MRKRGWEDHENRNEERVTVPGSTRTVTCATSRFMLLTTTDWLSTGRANRTAVCPAQDTLNPWVLLHLGVLRNGRRH
jgi:hypothetical protein